MSELLVGTRKGLFVLDGDAARGFDVRARAFAGETVEFARRDPRTGRVLAAVTSMWYGPKLWFAEDPAGEWHQATGAELPEDGALERVWCIALGADAGTVFAGADPGVLFESHDGGETWAVNRGLWDEPSRPEWQPGGGGLCVHSVVPWPGDPSRLTVGISAAGVWNSDDGGRSWRRGNAGLVAGYVPEEAREGNTALCIHHVERAPARPERLFMQFHGGVYRSDDAGESWVDIAAGLPSDFGFPLAVDPADPDSAYVIPLVGAEDRATPEGRVRVYETRDAGASWTPRGDGLPQEHAYLTVLRQAFTSARDGGDLELYFGATSGDVFASADAGRSWTTAAAHLPPVLSVTATT